MRLKLWLRSDKLEALDSDTWAALGQAAVGQSVHLHVRECEPVHLERGKHSWGVHARCFNHHWPDTQTWAVIPIRCVSFHPSFREVKKVFYLFTRDLKNVPLKVLCYPYLTSELIPLNSSCLVTPCLYIGFTGSASTAILCRSQPSYSYFNCRSPS